MFIGKSVKNIIRKGWIRKMRKSIKRVAATLMAATMVLGAMTSVYADGEEATETTEAEDVIEYSLVGSEELGTNWNVESADYYMTKVTNNVYKFETTAIADVDGEFKIVKDGENEGWNLQFEYGTGAFHDNASQFKVSVVEGDALTIYANIATGEVTLFKNGENATSEVSVNWDSTPEWKEAHPDDEWLSLADAKTKYAMEGVETTYSVVGTAQLGIDWAPENPAYIVPGSNGAYTKTMIASAAGDLEFKIVEDGEDNAWTMQLQYGVVNGFGDNKSQFKVAAEAGDVFEVTFVPETGDVTILKNGAIDADALVNWESTDEWKTEHADDEWVSLSAAKEKFVYADAETTYSVVGTTDLIGLNWEAQDYAYVVPEVDGVYKKVVVAAVDSDALEFKILQDGPDSAWANQLQLGVAEFGDNKSQFRVAAQAGDVFEITFTPANGDVNVKKNGVDYDYLVRWATKDEDDQDFLTKAEALAKYVNTSNDDGNTNNDNTANDNTNANNTVANNTPSAVTPQTTTQTQQAAKTGDAAPVALLVLLVSAVAVVTVAAKKKEA